MSDYISRQAAIDAFNRIKNTLKNPETAHYDTLMFYEIEDVLEDVEPADVAPVVHSRWSDEMERVDTYHPFAGFETDYYRRCLNCGRRGKGFSWNFCPYCGAKMDGKE